MAKEEVLTYLQDILDATNDVETFFKTILCAMMYSRKIISEEAL